MMIQTVRLAKVLGQALRAPSVHNTQPWRWQVRGDVIDLFADLGRQRPATDPGGRDLMISCGAALHHLVVALAHEGHDAYVTRLPDPENDIHLATVALGDAPPNPTTAHLFHAIARRHTERRRMSHRPVPEPVLAALLDSTRHFGVQLVPIDGVQEAFTAAFVEATEREGWTPSRTTELRIWSHHEVGRSGVRGRDIASLSDDAAAFLLLTTAEDRSCDRLRTGEALSSMLLTATNAGLATMPLSIGPNGEILRLAEGITQNPQLVVRVGWPVARGAELTHTPRRKLASVLIPTES
jgi:nitroreductase